MIICGLDASTSTVGWSFSDDGFVFDAGFIDISKLNTTKEKCFCVISLLKNKTNNIHHINLESPLLGFGFGKSSQQTIIKLIKFNGLLEYLLSEEFKIPVNLINVNTARKKVIGMARIKGLSGKELVKQELPKIITNLSKFDVLNKKGNIDKRVEDIRDSIIMSLYG
jgi:hypothetical protein